MPCAAPEDLGIPALGDTQVVLRGTGWNSTKDIPGERAIGVKPTLKSTTCQILAKSLG